MFDKIKNRISILAGELFYSFFPDEQRLNEIKKLRSLTIETTNICIANCIFCGYQYMKRKKQIMKQEIFKKTISDFVETGGGRPKHDSSCRRSPKRSKICGTYSACTLVFMYKKDNHNNKLSEFA
jgi:hypothetical protein